MMISQRYRVLAMAVLASLGACSQAKSKDVGISGASSDQSAAGAIEGVSVPSGSPGTSPTVGSTSGTGSAAQIAQLSFFAQLDAAEETMFEALPQSATELKLLCDRDAGSQDAVNLAFCPQPGATYTPPVLTGLADLLTLLGLTVADSSTINQKIKLLGKNKNNDNAPPSVVFTGHSSSLVARHTSAVNPRVFIFQTPTGQKQSDMVGISFVRGEQSVEIIANDPAAGGGAGLNFYFIKFKQACNSQPGGCTTTQLFSPAIEKDWVSYSLYEDDDLANTPIDCRRCHQPDGPDKPKIMRMQEIAPPYTHFFSPKTTGGAALIADFQNAHGTAEAYAQVPASMIAKSDPSLLAQFVTDNGFGMQPNAFDSAAIEQQVVKANAAQPADNSVAGISAVWSTIYEAAVAGAFIPVPYHDVKITDPALLPEFIASYKKFLAGGPATEPLVDPRTMVLASQSAAMGFTAKAGLTGPQLLAQACLSCHNSKLDQTISRAKFNADVSTISPAERSLAVQRLSLPLSDPKRMPPPRSMVLSAAEIGLLTTTLVPAAGNAAGTGP